MTAHIERLGSAHVDALAGLFQTIAGDATAELFHPHDFNAAAARSIARYAGRDIYLGLWRDGALKGYGMLRGFDAGYEIPSLGIYLAPDARGSGLARLFMRGLHERAQRAGARKIRLKVYASNLKAVELYASLGYRFTGEEKGQRVAVFDLPSGDSTS